nr:hypothetical protein [Ktedonobacter racemifer]
MRIEVIHHDDHFSGIGILFFKNLLHEARPVLLGAVLSHLQVALARQWFIGNKQIRAALFFVGVIFAGNLPRFGWFRGIFVFDEILAHLIHTDPGHEGIIRLAVHIEDVLQVIDKIPIRLLGKTPRLFAPGL